MKTSDPSIPVNTGIDGSEVKTKKKYRQYSSAELSQGVVKVKKIYVNIISFLLQLG